MKIEYIIDEKYDETKITICTNRMTEKIQKIIDKIKEENEKYIYGYSNEKIYLIDEKEIETIYAENKKVFIRKEDGTIYECKKKLYELEKILPKKFIRISNSEIVNFRKVQNLDFKVLGTIILNFQSKRSTYVSRRYMKKIKEYLEI